MENESIKRIFYITVTHPNGEEYESFEIVYYVTPEEEKLLSAIEQENGSFIDSKDLNGLYRILEQKALNKATEHFFMKSPDAYDNEFDDYQIYVDV